MNPDGKIIKELNDLIYPLSNYFNIYTFLLINYISFSIPTKYSINFYSVVG